MRQLPFLILVAVLSLTLSLTAQAALQSVDGQAALTNPITNQASGTIGEAGNCLPCAIAAARAREKAGKGMWEEAAILPANDAAPVQTQNGKTVK